MPDSGIAALTPVTGLNVTLTDRVLSVRINRPSSLNSLTVPILTGIADTLERAAADPVVKVVRLGGWAAVSAPECLCLWTMCGAEGRRPPSSKRPTAQYAPWPRYRTRL